MVTDAELLRVKVALDGMRQVTNEVKSGTATIVADVKKVQAENVRTTRTQEQFIRALYGGAAAARQQTAATRQQSQATAAATARERERRIVNDQLAASIHRQVTQAQQATRANQQLAESSKKVSHSQRDQADKMATLAKGSAAIAAGYAATRFVAMGGMAAIRRFEENQGFVRATRANLGLSRGTALAVRTDDFADRLGLRREPTREAIKQLAGTGELTKPDDILGTLQAFMALATKGGATSEGRERAFTQYVQVASNGKFQGDELRSIQEAGVPIRKLLKDAGLGDRIGSQTNPLTFKEVNDALLKFGGSSAAQKLLKEGAETATASLNRLANVGDDLAAAAGDALTPAVKELAAKTQAFADGIDPEQVKSFTGALLQAGPWILGIAGTLKVGSMALQAASNYSSWQLFRLAKSGGMAAVALEQLAGSAGVARVAGGGLSTGAGGGGFGGGFGGGSGGSGAGGAGSKPGTSSATVYGLPYTQATREAHIANVQAVKRRQDALNAMNRSRLPAWATTPLALPPWAGKIGRGVAGIGRGLGYVGTGLAGSFVGDAIGDRLSGGNEWARTGGAIAGGIAAPLIARAGAAGVAKLVAGKFGAGAAVGAGGTALAAGSAFGLLAGLGVLGVEALTGVAGTDRSILVEWENRAAGNGTYNQRAKTAQDQEQLLKVLQEINVIRRTFQRSWKSNGLPTTDQIMHYAGGKYDYLQQLIKQRDALGGRPPSESARIASPHNRQAEANAMSQRNVHAR